MELRGIVRDVLGDALSMAGVTDPARRGADRLSIATFHRVLPESERRAYPIRGLVVTPDELDWFVGFLGKHFTIGRLDETWARFRIGERPQRPLLALTFDDGQHDNYLHARPILDRYGVKASFYVPSGHIDAQVPIWHDRLGFALLRALQAGKAAAVSDALGKPVSVEEVPARIDETKSLSPSQRAKLVESIEAMAPGPVPDWSGLMSWAQIRELAEDGHEIGSHSVHHQLLPQCDDSVLTEEVRQSKSRIEEAIDREVTTFCYPNGDSDARVEAAVEKAGYACAVTTTWGNNTMAQPCFALRRCDINPEHARTSRGALSAPRLAWRLSGLHPGLQFA